MRKDVEKLPELFPRPSAEQKDYLYRLGWPPNASDLAARYSILLSAIDFNDYSVGRPMKLLDVGCGLGLLLDYLIDNSLMNLVDYTGVDLVEPILREAQSRWPGRRFDRRDVRDRPYENETFDYCIVCGIFTAKNGNSYDDTVALAESTLKAVWPSVKLGLAFNSMSKHVDWEREDLFHWPLDDIMAFCKRDLSRHVSLNLDYGLWEVSTLVRKAPRLRNSKVPSVW
jgi:SAM-dependent methyltransferase